MRTRIGWRIVTTGSGLVGRYDDEVKVLGG